MNKFTTNAAKRLRILVIDDETGILDFIQLGLGYEGYDCLTAADGKTGLRLAFQEQPDLIILDLMLPGMDGFEVCRRLRQNSNVPIIMLTARDELGDRVQGLDLGADDYLTKPFEFKELAARVRAVLRRKDPGLATKDPALLQVQDLTLDAVAHQVWRGTRQIELSVREFDLLHYLMRHPNQVLTRSAIIEQVWGFDYDGDGNIIEVYVRYLRQKLGEPNLIHTVRGIGYVVRTTRPLKDDEV
jgi:DNA-binding response OmpR family regulator